MSYKTLDERYADYARQMAVELVAVFAFIAIYENRHR